MVPPNEACLYGCINWSLAQTQQQCSVGLSQAFLPMRDGKARPMSGFHFNVPEWCATLAKSSCLESRTEAHPGGRKSTAVVSLPILLTLARKWAIRDGIPNVFQSTTSSSSSVVQVPKFVDQWRRITSNRFVPNMVMGHHLQLRSHPPLFSTFKQFNIKEAAAHHPISHHPERILSIIQKELDELLAKGTIEPSSGGAGFYSNLFVVPKHTGGLWPILNLKQFNHYIHIPNFKMFPIRHVWQVIHCGGYAFSIDFKDAYLHIPIVKHHHHFFTVCLAKYIISVESFTFLAGHSP